MNLQGYQRLSVVSVCLVTLLGVLPGCENEADKRRREAAATEKQQYDKSLEKLVKSYQGTPEEQAKRREEGDRVRAENEREWAAKKAFAIAVSQGKQLAPTTSPPPEIVTRPSEVRNGACPVYDNLKTGTRFRVTPELSGKYGLPDGWYTLDQSCRPVVLEESLERQQERKKEAKRCGAPFHGFYVGEVIRIEKDEQQFFGYPPGIYTLGQGCVAMLIDSEKQFPASVRENAYREAVDRRAVLEKTYRAEKEARRQKAAQEGRLEAEPSKNCPAPYQDFQPGQFKTVRSQSAKKDSKLIPGGDWWFDIDCKPTWYGPEKVVEPAASKMEEEKGKAERQRVELISEIILWGGAGLVLLLVLHRVTMRMTGRGLIEWLRSGGKRE